DAQTLIDRVKRIHLKVSGVDSEGKPYAASDPHLLTWVHVAVTNLKHPVKESISLKRVMGQHLFKPSFGCHVRSSLTADKD
ncbi:oxygenase MpaB family protein, partial [Pantoea agglomerans]|uniref:oxygenase MpaB family protein n=1 Tax=Enterobacter agglomerans TaxID=549 RepID=UPI001F5C2C52